MTPEQQKTFDGVKRLNVDIEATLHRLLAMLARAGTYPVEWRRDAIVARITRAVFDLVVIANQITEDALGVKGPADVDCNCALCRADRFASTLTQLPIFKGDPPAAEVLGYRDPTFPRRPS